MVEKIEACQNYKFFMSSGYNNVDEKNELKYEHFIGPLVIISAINGL